MSITRANKLQIIAVIILSGQFCCVSIQGSGRVRVPHDGWAITIYILCDLWLWLRLRIRHDI